MNLFDELRRIIPALEAEGIPYALVGGLAYSILVKSRSTEDIDILATPEDWPRIVNALKPLGYLDLAGPMDFAKARIRRLVLLKEGEGALLLDVILADDSLLVEGLRNALVSSHAGFTLRVAPAETIIEMKTRRGSDQDLVDIKGLQALISEGSAE